MVNPQIEKARKDRFASTLLMAFGIFVGVLFFVMFAIAKQKHELAMSWPTVDGKVTKSAISEQTTLDKVGRRSIRRTEYVHQWQVTYQVGDQSFKKDYKETYDSDGIAQDRCNEWHTGVTVAMHYNPTDHAEARRHRSDVLSPWAGLFFGGIMVLIAGGMRFHFSNKIKAIEKKLSEVEKPRRCETSMEELVLKRVSKCQTLKRCLENRGPK